MEKNLRSIIEESIELLTKISKTPKLDIEVILCHILKWDKIKLMMNYDYILSPKDREKFDKMIAMRTKRMPIAYIINNKEFMGFDFYVDENVLIPRPDTELIVEELIIEVEKKIDNNKFEEDVEGFIKNTVVLDMCTGSGAIILSASKIITDRGIKKEQLEFYGVDISKGALNVSSINAKNLNVDNVEFIESDLFSSNKLDKIKGKIDIIVSNPPYIEEDVIVTLESDVKDYEPMIALTGGVSGMDFYNKIIDDAVCYLKNGGILIFESGHDQSEKIKNKMQEVGFREIEIKNDLSGYGRMVKGKKLFE